MKRLRHPIRAIREPFGTAGLIVALVALVAALGGTAFAAAKLNSTQKKEVEKIAKKYAGKPGAPGANGAPGAKGDNGAAGANGTNGTNGTPGANGKSVATPTSLNPGQGGCSEGGISVEVEGSGAKKSVCNGEEGPQGNPWTAGGTLPSGSTETGTFAAAAVGATASEGSSVSEISFSIPLTSAPEAFYLKIGETTTACPGLSEGIPQAAAGKLCVYEAASADATFAGFYNPTKFFEPGVSKSGTVLFISVPANFAGQLYGVWAVTA